MKENEYKRAVDSIEISEEAKQRIIDRNINIKKEKCIMKSRKKTGIIALAAAMVLGATVFAASNIIVAQHGYTSAIPDYKQLPTAEQCINDVGFTPILVDKFENGFSFESGHIGTNFFENDEGEKSENFKSLDFYYNRGDDSLLFVQDKYMSEMPEEGEPVAKQNGIGIYYSGYTNKQVPPDYKMTEEDKKAEKSGELIFSYGASEVSVEEVKSVSWSVGDMHYSMTTVGVEISENELTEMAKEAINAMK